MAWVKVERAEKKVEPFSVDFAYTGTVQEYVVPVTGLYKLEVYGAGATSTRATGKGGGVSIGYKKLKKGTKVYICCGGYVTGGSRAYSGTGYNGGGGCICDWTNSPSYASSGGGATHIAFVSGTLSEIGKETFDKQGLIVAGGASGAFYWGSWELFDQGSYAGGGTTDATGGATQTSGYAFGVGISLKSTSDHEYGGGGGYYGGKRNQGGSGWIDGVPAITYKNKTYAPSTSIGGNHGQGKAKISYIA